MVKIQLLTLSALQQYVCLSEQLAKYYRSFACKFQFKNSTPRLVSELIVSFSNLDHLCKNVSEV